MKPTVLNRILMVLGFGGIFVAGVLTLAEAMHKEVPCGKSGGCAVVAADPSSHMLGIPNAWLGLFAYIVLAGLASYRELVGVTNPKAKTTVMVGWLLSALGTLASCILTYISVTQIHATCMWCLTSFAVMALTLVAYLLLQSSLDKAPVEEAPKGAGFALPVVLLVASVLAVGVTQFAFGEMNVKSFDAPQDVMAQLLGPNAHVINPNGELTIVEFGDLDCPTCKGTFSHIDQIVKNSNGKIRYVFHNFPLINNREHVGALWGAEISEIAAESGKFYDYLNAVYRADSTPEGPMPDNTQMLSFAAEIGLDVKAIQKRLDAASETDPAILKVTDDLNLAQKCKIEYTPTFIIILKDKKVQVTGGKVFNTLEEPQYKPYVGV